MEKYANVVGGSPHDLNIPLFVKTTYDEADYVTICFKKPKGFIFEPGNWIDIRFLSPDLSIGKTYSIASSPTESDILITFKKGVSKFKKAFEQISVGDTMLITWFSFQQKVSILIHCRRCWYYSISQYDKRSNRYK